MALSRFGVTVEILDLDDEGGRLLGTMQVNGSNHHLCFIRLREPGLAYRRKWQSELDKVYDLAEHFRVSTVAVPGYKGEWVCYLHPYQS